jgi:hypothetical protein
MEKWNASANVGGISLNANTVVWSDKGRKT